MVLTYLKARSADLPKTWPKKKPATVTPLWAISLGVAAAKYATFASKYSTVHIPRPRGPAILRVLTGLLTSFNTYAALDQLQKSGVSVASLRT